MIHIKDDEGRTIGYADRAEHIREHEKVNYGGLAPFEVLKEDALILCGFTPRESEFDPKDDTIENLEKELDEAVTEARNVGFHIRSIEIEVDDLIRRLEFEVDQDLPVIVKDAKRAALLELKEIKEII